MEANCWGHQLSQESTQVEVGVLRCWEALKHPLFNVIRAENTFQNHASSYARNYVLMGEWKRWPTEVAENGILSSTKLRKPASPGADPQDLPLCGKRCGLAVLSTPCLTTSSQRGAGQPAAGESTNTPCCPQMVLVISAQTSLGFYLSKLFWRDWVGNRSVKMFNEVFYIYFKNWWQCSLPPLLWIFLPILNVPRAINFCYFLSQFL